MSFSAEDWHERFKAAGGKGRVDEEKIWFSESGPQTPEALTVIAELQGLENEDAHQQVVAYVRALHHGFTGWANF